MEKLWKYFLSLVILICLYSCERINDFYDQPTKEGKIAIANVKYQVLQDTGFYSSGKYYDKVLIRQSELKEIIKLNPGHERAWIDLANIYLRKGMYKEWKDHFDKALFLDPVKYQGIRGYGLLYRFRDYEKALSDFNGLKVLNPNGTDYIRQTNLDYLRGICYMQIGDYREAHAHFDKYIRDETKTLGKDYLYESVFLYKAICYIRTKEYDEAIKMLNDGIQMPLKYADFYYHKARVLYFKQEYDDILGLLSIAEDLIYENQKHRDYSHEEIEEIYIEDVLEFRDYIRKKLRQEG